MGSGSGDLVWTPPPDARRRYRVGRYLEWLAASEGVQLPDRAALWQWSVDQVEPFWDSLWRYFDVVSHSPHDTVLDARRMPGARWFPGATLNYAEQVFRPSFAPAHDARLRDDDVVVHGFSETRAPVTLTRGVLRTEVARAAAALRRLGVSRGDRVVAYAPNLPETVVAYLAVASLGAVWSSCAPEFGARSVVDRFGQIEPAVLLVVGGYRYRGRDVDRRDDVAAVRRSLPTVRVVVDLEYGAHRVPDALSWRTLLDAEPERRPTFEAVPFDHPLVVLFSSGTTGLPKAIVHGHGGVLLEHLKNHTFSWDLGPGDRLLWFTTTAWMMWNALVSALLVGAGVVCVDGDPAWPDLDLQWRLAQDTGATVMGVSPGFAMACRAAGIDLPHRDLALRVVASAGAPLPPEGYRWLVRQLPGRYLNVGSGGTDVCTGLVQGDPLLPVRTGTISGPALGVDACAFDPQGRPVVGELGELVVRTPMPSMPVAFWGDPDGSRLRAAYFDHYPGVWRHGDWVVFDDDGSCRVTGRSDATLNRGGVRLGTAEFYRVVEELAGVADSLVVHLDEPGTNGELLLFVVTAPGVRLDDDLRGTVRSALRTQLSPRHVPDQVLAVPAVPRTVTGKKLELPVKRILQGAPVDAVTSPGALAVPGALDAFVALAASRAGGDPVVAS